MTMATLIETAFKNSLAYSLRGLVHNHHGRKHSSMRADMVLEKELRVLHLDPQAAEETVSYTGYSLSIGDLKVYHRSDVLFPTRSHFLVVPLPKG